MSTKISIEKAFEEYTTKELVDFHANLNAIFIAVNEDFHVLPLLLRVHLELGKRPAAKPYLDAVADMLKISA